MRGRLASSLVVLLAAACGPPEPQAPRHTAEGAWFCPKQRFQTCFHAQPDCVAAYPGDICVLTRPVFCEDEDTCYRTRYDCEYFSICYRR